MLPHEPESLDAHRARYAKAVESTYDVEAVADGTQPRPGQNRAHVFDREDGLRLIISHERFPNGKTCLHVSASAMPGSEIVQALVDESAPVLDFIALVQDYWRAISGRHEVLFLHIVDMKGVLHFIVWDEKLEPHAAIH